MSLPNFFIIGGQRCATGWIAQCLRDHPEVYMAVDETRFFDRHIDKGLGWWEETFFSQCHQEKAIGEKTANYMYDASVAMSMHAQFPDAKLICCLRNPVERLISGIYMKYRQQGWSQHLDFDELIKLETDLIDRGFYFQLLEPYLKLFGRDKLKIIFYEDRIDREKEFISDVYNFLGVDNQFVSPNLNRQIKPGMLENSNQFISKFNRFLFQRNSMFNKLYSRFRPTIEYDYLTKQQKKQLYNTYKNDIYSLENLCQRSLRIWYKNYI